MTKLQKVKDKHRESELHHSIWTEYNVTNAMKDYGKYCADQAWNDALKEVDALMQKPCWDLTLVEDINKLKN